MANSREAKGRGGVRIGDDQGMSRQDYELVGSPLLKFSLPSGLVLHYETSPTDYIKFSSPCGLSARLESLVTLPSATIHLRSPTDAPSAVTWRLSCPLSSVVPTLAFDPLGRGPFELSAQLPITPLNPTLIYRSRARALELKLAPDLTLASARISGDGTLSSKGVVHGTLAVQLGQTTVRATACGKSQLLWADLFHTVPTTGLITSLSGGISAELYQGRELRAATAFAKLDAKCTQISLVARTEKVDPAHPSFEVRFNARGSGKGAAGLVKATAGRPLELTACAFVNVAKRIRIGCRGTPESLAAFVTTRDVLREGVDTVAAVTFPDWMWNSWHVGVEFTVKPTALQ
jgi:hypothetical protein